MIQYNNQNSFKEIHYNGHDIQKAYCDNGDLIWQKQSPGPTPFEGKFKFTLNDSSTVSAECDSSSSITQSEVLSPYKSTLVSTEIGRCVTSIGQFVFSNCTGLTSVIIPNSVTSIGGAAFSGCRSLTSVTIPNSVTSIGGAAFQYCSSLTSIDIPNSVTSIESTTFYNCSGLTSVAIGGGVTTIGEDAFSYCVSLTSCTIGTGITSIASYAFYGCNSLSSVTVLATQPPSLGMFSFVDAPIAYGTGTIYVPAESVEAYKSASDWSDYADIIVSIPNS